ncbi:hypothetical protein N7512_002755 [Penicillium capsulatum]|nr:hypothetical protein N7512_002755 [Penicillium capsulatum]
MQYLSLLAIFGALFGAQVVSAGDCPAMTCYQQDQISCTSLSLAQVPACQAAITNACNKKCS